MMSRSCILLQQNPGRYILNVRLLHYMGVSIGRFDCSHMMRSLQANRKSKMFRLLDLVEYS